LNEKGKSSTLTTKQYTPQARTRRRENRRKNQRKKVTIWNYEARNFLQVRASFHIVLRNPGNNRATAYAEIFAYTEWRFLPGNKFQGNIDVTGNKSTKQGNKLNMEKASNLLRLLAFVCPGYT
jgi:hypothetical protein